MIDYSFTYANLEFYLCVLARVSAFIFAAPFFGQKGVPNREKIGFSLLLSMLVYTSVIEYSPLEYGTVLGYAVIVIKETLTGILIGYSANICNTILDFAGKIIDMEAGLSMVNLIDPATGDMGSISGVIYQYAVMLMLIISGMYRYILQALIETFRIIPVNGAVLSGDRFLAAMLRFMVDYVTIGFRICLPVFAVMLLLNAVLGIMAKLAPQMNMFSVGMQIKVLTGLCILYLTAGLLPSISNFIFREMKTMMTVFVNAMS